MGSTPPTLRIATLLTLCVLLVYANSLPNEFLAWDDETLVLENPYLQQGTLEEIEVFFLSPPRLPTEPTPASALDAIRQGLARRYELGGEYLPVRDLSWWIDARLGGRLENPINPARAYSPFVFHLGNVLLHLVT